MAKTGEMTKERNTRNTKIQCSKKPKLDTIVISSDDSDDPEACVICPGGTPATCLASTSYTPIKIDGPRLVIPAVDPLCTQLQGEAVVYNEGCDVYDATLSQTSVQANQNKFFSLQLLKDKLYDIYYVWFHWGRLGEKGSCSLTPCEDDIVKAKLLFEQKFLQKTRNEWENRRKFVKVPGKYNMLKMDYESSVENESDKFENIVKEIHKSSNESRLQPSLTEVMRFISDVKAMEKNVVEMQFDIRKMPLGKLKKEQIQAGYKALRKIENCLDSACFGSSLTDACNEFYSCIPHAFGRRRPDVINTREKIQEKMQLLEALEDIEVAVRLHQNELRVKNIHPLDRFYASLHCELTELDKNDSDYQLVSWYLSSSHGETHMQYRLELQHLFRVNKSEHAARFVSLEPRMLLWHGSRASNWAGILSEGLRIAPSHVPSSGYMFDKGVYFADCVSKSANYCWPNPKVQEGILALCEVSLGNMKKLVNADTNVIKRIHGYNSVMGQGRNIPDEKDNVILPDGVVVPCGKLVKSALVHSANLHYNEYIVYNTNQIKIRYLVKVRFGKR
ncbi:poly [ADP-ribose] polymerase 2 isoform X2 [Ixodes scapularis]